MKDVLWRYAWIGTGSALGGMGRYWLSGLVAQRFGETFPWGTMFVNVTGCFAIGFFATITGTEGRLLVPSLVRQFFMIGVCGGYTTFSSFSLQTLNLAREGDLFEASANAALALVLCLAFVWLGHTLALALNDARGG
jgi:CrcB protein